MLDSRPADEGGIDHLTNHYLPLRFLRFLRFYKVVDEVEVTNNNVVGRQQITSSIQAIKESMYNAKAYNPVMTAMRATDARTAPLSQLLATGKDVLCALSFFDLEHRPQVASRTVGRTRRSVNIDGGYQRKLPIDP